ncbi:MAG TPA: TetR family transcriptional regulator [Marmoricola sp.]|nr:TetR family transcriptional regulator [Marmoricola sp.]
MTSVTRGRRPGSPDTRAAILDAARALFAVGGMSGTSVRAIAAKAGVDPALVHHYFGTKDDLFVAALALPVDLREVLAGVVAAGEPETVAERLLRVFFSVWDDPDLQLPLIALARNLTDPSSKELLRDGFLRVVVGPIAAAVGVEQPEARVPLVASQIMGLILMRYLLQVEPLASMSSDDLVAIYAPTIQRYLTGALPPPTGQD